MIFKLNELEWALLGKCKRVFFPKANRIPFFKFKIRNETENLFSGRI
jgi:hypothetical protein